MYISCSDARALVKKGEPSALGDEFVERGRADSASCARGAVKSTWRDDVVANLISQAHAADEHRARAVPLTLRKNAHIAIVSEFAFLVNLPRATKILLLLANLWSARRSVTLRRRDTSPSIGGVTLLGSFTVTNPVSRIAKVRSFWKLSSGTSTITLCGLSVQYVMNGKTPLTKRRRKRYLWTLLASGVVFAAVD